jgi:hypothetical protein
VQHLAPVASHVVTQRLQLRLVVVDAADGRACIAATCRVVLLVETHVADSNAHLYTSTRRTLLAGPVKTTATCARQLHTRSSSQNPSVLLLLLLPCTLK